MNHPVGSFGNPVHFDAKLIKDAEEYVTTSRQWGRTYEDILRYLNNEADYILGMWIEADREEVAAFGREVSLSFLSRDVCRYRKALEDLVDITPSALSRDINAVVSTTGMIIAATGDYPWVADVVESLVADIRTAQQQEGDTPPAA
jgi:hypothetical protein